MNTWADSIEQIPEKLLLKYFTAEAPLGPLNARVVTDDTVLSLLTERDLANFKGQSQRPSIVVGRRGSGKTSYLRKLGIQTPDRLFIEIRTEKTFNLLLGAIHNVIRDSISVEAVTVVWDGVFWNCLFWILHRHGRPYIGRVELKLHLIRLGIAELKTLEAVMNSLSVSFERISKESGGFALERIADFLRGTQFEELKEIAILDLESTAEVAMVVLDSLDDYPVRVDDFKKSLSGLLKCAGEFNAVVRNFEIRMCLPSELYWEFVEKVSTNSIKDFSNQLVVRWQVGELLLAACRRLMIYLKLFHPTAYQTVRHIPLNIRKDADEFLYAIFPRHVRNLNDVHERTDLYLLRHTQLLPRQLFLMLGEILKLNRVNDNFTPGKTSFVTEESIRLGIRDTEDRVVEEILSAFRNRYPEAKEICMAILPSIQKVFSSEQFSRAVKQYCEEHGRQHRTATIRRMLIEIGAFGKIDSQEGIYTRGKFEYTMTSRLPVGADDKLCVHPLFSRVFDCQSNGRSDAPILPWASDL